ncbi:AER274Wp [Eremothecium gossypii ATCC 10895]|uniref:AER274Wp n=1 Tax=Eremothecium gossypii (strain ATCC 10895 / CBS 109.51 / FGSC 9923 / NRRL Y-1056) TaxID=284811 RepID=Q756I7_EREGS|nr:AER274Wp [Eremothecium gossypii ATCC 10895]AAS52955.1 AER274Wp [Eremothecium gossypii ATCC 10895]
MEDKYIGLLLAITSSLAIGSSFILTKLGLNAASEQNNFQGAGYEYLKNPVWWGGMVTMVIGEVANFAAYTFAPAILVTPLGALSVIIGAILAAVFLKEELGTLGKLGCTICLLGSVIIILHAPSDKEIQTVDEILEYARQPAFVLYTLLVVGFAVFMIYQVVPQYGNRNPMVYISICSTVGSISVMAIKAFGIAVKLTLSGNNQFTHASSYMFIIVVVVCILTQMNYFNKALDQFDTSIVNPLYYVTFTTATLTASFILFRNFDESSTKDSGSLVCGFLIVFAGVYLLNLSRKKNRENMFTEQNDVANIPLDNNFGGFTVRKSMQRDARHRAMSHVYQSEEMVHLTETRDSNDDFEV